ncbi:MAG: energy transducer TonB, partial [Alphaproteobacteria bacterium]|nr:energy transducer TonB [Alphaproteobacteria bacterium]
MRPLAAAWVVVVAAMGGVLGWLATTPVEAPVVEVGVQIPPPETAVASVPASPAPRAPAPVGAPDARSPDPEEGALRGISR